MPVHIRHHTIIASHIGVSSGTGGGWLGGGWLMVGRRRVDVECAIEAYVPLEQGRVRL